MNYVDTENDVSYHLQYSYRLDKMVLNTCICFVSLLRGVAHMGCKHIERRTGHKVDNMETALYGKLVLRREDIDETEEDICK